jgi:glycerol uptake facilitator-like aquaporin
MNKGQMIQSLLGEFLGTASIIAGYQYFYSLPIILAIILIAKSVTLGHLNPAVTMWYYMAGKIDVVTAVSYVITQCIAVLVIAKTDL